MEEKEAEGKIESALFIAGRFLSISELVALTDLNPLVIKEVLPRIISRYAGGIRIIEKNNLYKMDVAPEFSYIVNRLATGSSEFTKAEQSTLAIIAYKQPVKQSIIVKIRGNKAYDHVRKFLQLGLIKGKRAGHTKILELSEEFYDYFKLGKKDSAKEGE